MKTIAALILAASLTGCSVAVPVAMNAIYGESCVGPNVKVGDELKKPDGTVGIVREISGTSSSCSRPDYPQRAKIEIVKTAAK